ncbi:MAG: CDP-diacylglycerol--glycerol-3-phosphate 3-phosphatidyltransferase [Succinivibrio sp.]|jgi:CDP-diacylglycerol--glycerol-3-phosphate 3-phosphatidyltransferase|nr:CDP-diacylglycerol--glycerol-3-phosphate 3-phosphatidyltransferase [Succinivibrio sp.]
MLNLPNVLTLIRLALIPVFVILFYWPTEQSNLLAAIVFIIAAMTDLLDGFLARKLHKTTKFGAFLDPVADKIMVCVALVLVVEYYSVHVSLFFPHINLFVTIPAMIIVAREITVSALREWMAELGKRALVAVSWVGKWKTTIQLVSIALLIWRYNEAVIYGALAMLAVATVLTIWSMAMYLKVGFENMRETRNEAKNETERLSVSSGPAKKD